MIGKLRVYSKVMNQWTEWSDSDIDLISVSRSVLGDRMEVKYIFKGINYDNVFNLTNFIVGGRDRIVEFFINNVKMHSYDTINGNVIVQEFHKDDDFTVEISFFVDVDDIC